METYRIRFILATVSLVLLTFGLLSCNTASEYQKTVVQARESVLRDNLSQMRKLIDQYAADKGKLPQSLEELARAEYMREIPDDPITGKKDWRVIIGEDPSGKSGKGMVDIRSVSSAISTEGKPYSEW